MKSLTSGMLLVLLLMMAVVTQAAEPVKRYPVEPVFYGDVEVTGGFWKERLDTHHAKTVPHVLKQCVETGRLRNFAKAGDLLEGPPEGHYFNDSDVFKVIEGLAYSLKLKPDPKLEAQADEIIDWMAAAQWEDGYLYTHHSIPEQQPNRRWRNRSAHELYNVGHLYEGAVAYYEATGKRKLLDVAIKNADLICREFGPGKKEFTPGHQEIELALVRLYRATGDEKYLTQAKHFLDLRGHDEGNDYGQDHLPVVDQLEAVGHAVRAVYMYSAMTDIAALTGDEEYTKAVHSLWENIASKKMAITGGVGSSASGGEAFSEEYAIPNMRTYNETCGAIAFSQFNHRMFLLTGESKYIDLLEQTIYSGFLAGVAMTGDMFFYPNPLESNGQHERSPWFDCACCPANAIRFMPSIQGYAYAHQGENLFVNLFHEGNATIKMENGSVGIKQQTDYPWNGKVRFTVDPEKKSSFTLNLRIPGWAKNEAIATDLYRYLKKDSGSVTLKVNGKATPLRLKNGFVQLKREWKSGDVVELDLPLKPRRVVAHKNVIADQGKVALQLGPIVYCFEFPDAPEEGLRNMFIPDETELEFEFRDDLLGGIGVIKAHGGIAIRDKKGKPTLGKKLEFTAIPYYAWAHRGRGVMRVWVPHELEYSNPLPQKTIASTSKVTTSRRGRGTLASVADQQIPKAGNASLDLFYNWWPKNKSREWVQYDFEKPQQVSKASVFWFNDVPTGGGCGLPASWRILYKEGSDWKPVKNKSDYEIADGRFNEVSFKSVKTDAMRLEVQLGTRHSSGIYEWSVK